MTDDLTYISSCIKEPANSVILSHRNPDGDALGSSTALAAYLEKKNHKVTVILPSEYPATMKWMPRTKDVLIFDNFPDEARAVIDKAEQIYALDFNSWERVDPLQLQLMESKAKKIVIDHHLDPEPYFDAYYCDSTASSTAELVYRLIEDLGEVDHIDIKMGESLYVGLLTDTGSFKYSIAPEVFRVASQLLNRGVDSDYVQNKVFNTLSLKNLELLGHCLNNRMRIFPELGMGLIFLNLADHKQFKIQRGDTEGIVNYILKMDGINMAAFVTEQNQQYIKLSLRSKGDFSVQKIASKYFNGGGHKNASGGRSDASLKDTVDRLVQIAHEYKSEILKSF